MIGLIIVVTQEATVNVHNRLKLGGAWGCLISKYYSRKAGKAFCNLVRGRPQIYVSAGFRPAWRNGLLFASRGTTDWRQHAELVVFFKLVIIVFSCQPLRNHWRRRCIQQCQNPA